MNLKRVSFPALLFCSTLAGLTGCLLDSDKESTSTDAHMEAIGTYTYTLSGDTLFMDVPADTSISCIGDELKVKVKEASVETTFFKIEGNTFTLYMQAKEHVDWSGLEPESTGIFIQLYSVYTRTSGNAGLEGSWKSTVPGYRMTEGNLTAEAKEIWDNLMELRKNLLRFGTTGLNFSGGKASILSPDIRWADRFLAWWNGELFNDKRITPDSARYDAKVAVVNRDTVKIMGNRTGEMVTIGFAKDGTKSYISDKTGRKAYSDVDNPASCPIENWYNEDFLPKNAKQEILIKRGAVRDNKRGQPSILPW